MRKLIFLVPFAVGTKTAPGRYIILYLLKYVKAYPCIRVTVMKITFAGKEVYYLFNCLAFAQPFECLP